MAARALLTLIRHGKKLPTGSKSYCCVPDRIGSREVVGYAQNGKAVYVDSDIYPMPAIRYKEVTPEIQALRNKEKGDWNKLTIEEKKLLYRASFRQTFAENLAHPGDGKSILGIAFFVLAIGAWWFVLVCEFVPPYPESYSDEARFEQYKRYVALDMSSYRKK